MSTTAEVMVTVDFAELASYLSQDEKLELIKSMFTEEADLDFEIQVAKLALVNIKQEFTCQWGGSVDPEFKAVFKDIKKVVK